MSAGIRDQLIHAYDAVEVDEVWKTVSIDIAACMSHPVRTSGSRQEE